MDLVDSQEGIKVRVNKEEKEEFLSRGKINTALILKDFRASKLQLEKRKKKVEKLPLCQTQVRVVSSLQRRKERMGK